MARHAVRILRVDLEGHRKIASPLAIELERSIEALDGGRAELACAVRGSQRAELGFGVGFRLAWQGQVLRVDDIVPPADEPGDAIDDAPEALGNRRVPAHPDESVDEP